MPTWMIVEDEPGIYEMLTRLFEIWNIEGIVFVDGKEALAWIDDVDQGYFRGPLPELALLDIGLPGPVKGHDVGARLRQSPSLGEMAVVLCTAKWLSPEEERQAIQQADADDLLHKPLPPLTELQQRLEAVIGARQKMTWDIAPIHSGQDA